MRQKVTVQPRLKRGEFFAAFPQKTACKAKKDGSLSLAQICKRQRTVQSLFISFLWSRDTYGSLFTVSDYIFISLGTSLCSYAPFDHEAVFIVCTVGVDQGLFIVFVEEVFVSQGNDLVIDPVEEGFVALGDGGSNGILASE